MRPNDAMMLNISAMYSRNNRNQGLIHVERRRPERLLTTVVRNVLLQATIKCFKTHYQDNRNRKQRDVDISINQSIYLHRDKSHRTITRGQSNLTKSASRGAHSPVRGHPRGSKFVPLNYWGRGSY